MNWMSTLGKWLPFLGILLVYITGSFVDVMEVDAAQYASMSREMLETGNYLQIFNRATDYLDKPPFLFWVSALSMKVFGVKTWAYKLPSILFSLLGIFSTYKLGERLYSQVIGRTAALVFGSTLAMIVINNDIKTDTILTAAIVFSIWMMVSYLQTKEWKYLLGSAVGIGIGMLTKGPIGVMMPVLAVGSHLLIKKELKQLLDWRLLIALLVIAIMLIPMSLGLYKQFGSNGIKFFFWTQSFGRITGENEWRNDTSVFFFSHVFLWAFLPWTFLAITALIKRFTGLKKDLETNFSEFYTLSGVVLVTLALSFSKFKLPHYIFIVFPLLAIITANHIHSLKNYVNWVWVQVILSCLAAILLFIILLYSFPEGGFIAPIILVLGVVGAIVAFLSLYRHEQTVYPSFIVFIAVGLSLNLHFYPQLLKYQANSVVGKLITEQQIEKDQFIGFATGGHALDFYSERIVPWKPDVASTLKTIKKGTIIYADQARYNALLKRNAVPDSIKEFDSFNVQLLSFQFLFSRKEAVKTNYLLYY
ncbi:ArnT family glycosyltransferase [Bacteroidota bacterium]